MDYRKQIDTAMISASIGKLSNGIPLRQIKNQDIIFTALCARAAIKGGLSSETSFTISDLHIQRMEACESVEELMDAEKNMFEDYIYRVHQLHAQSGVSSAVQRLREYIQLHITEKLDVPTLAKEVAYTENYLTKKFSAETGETLTDYILRKKIEYAKILLDMHGKRIQDVGESLGYNGASYFSNQFKKVTGVTPTEYLDKGERPSESD